MLFGFFDIIRNVSTDAYLIFYCLVHLDGILEDDRERVSHYIALSKDYKAPLNVIKILNSYILQYNQNDFKPHRDVASHILALLIEAESFQECA